jgi:hypothetical protein
VSVGVAVGAAVSVRGGVAEGSGVSTTGLTGVVVTREAHEASRSIHKIAHKTLKAGWERMEVILMDLGISLNRPKYLFA